MRVNALFTLSSCALINAKLSEDDGIDFGLYHTKAFDELAELYVDRRPTSKREMCTDLVNIVAAWCDGDSECDRKTRENMESIFVAVEEGGQDSELPDDFNEDVLDSISSMFSVLNTVTTGEDIDEIIGTLVSIEKEVQDLEGVSENHKNVAYGTLSVAIESARLWHQVYNDREHSLHGMHLDNYYVEAPDRKLHDYYADHSHDHYDPYYNHHDSYFYWWGNEGGGPFSLPDFNVTYAITEDVTTFFTTYAAAIASDISVVVPFSPNFFTTLSDVIAPTIAASSFIGSEADTFDD